MTIYDDQLPGLAQQLVEAKVCHEAKAELFRNERGLTLWPKQRPGNGFFFPLWEINKPGNLERLMNGDFEGITSQRLGDYDPTKPY